jgi:hypothetical protein
VSNPPRGSLTGPCFGSNTRTPFTGLRPSFAEGALAVQPLSWAHVRSTLGSCGAGGSESEHERQRFPGQAQPPPPVRILAGYTPAEAS